MTSRLLSRSTMWAVVGLIGICSLSPTVAYGAPILLSTPDITAGPEPLGLAVIAGPIPSPAWWAAGPGAWWSPTADQTFNDPYLLGTGNLPGDYVYDVTFDLTGYDLSTAVVSGNWTTDNVGGIKLNGVLSGFTRGSTDYGTPAPFSFNSGFNAGVNTLSFLVNNETGFPNSWSDADGRNPTGLYLDAAASADPVPEPASMVLLGSGLVALYRQRRRARR